MKHRVPAAPASRVATAERAAHDRVQNQNCPSAASLTASSSMVANAPKWEPPPWFLHQPSPELRGIAEQVGRVVGAGDLSIHTGEALIYDAIARMPAAPMQFPPFGPWRGSRLLLSLMWTMRDTAEAFARELDSQAIAVRKVIGPILIGRGRSDEVLAAAQAAGPDLSPAEIEQIAAEEAAWWLRNRNAA